MFENEIGFDQVDHTRQIDMARSDRHGVHRYVADPITPLIYHKKATIMDCSVIVEMCTPCSCPIVDLLEVSARMRRRRTKNYTVVDLHPLHWGQVCVTLQCLTYVVDTVTCIRS
jgi:hypothetical protein